MILTELRVENLRNIRELQLRPGQGVNLLTGANGAGKTSILEAIYLLSHARSFRTRRGEFLVRSGSDQLSVYGVVDARGGVATRLGLMHADGRWTAKVDGNIPERLTRMLERCAVVCFEPGSHALIAGPGDERRRFLDWGVFHVEHEFAETAQRYRRALRQRNAVLRANRTDAEVAAWDQELVAAAEPLAQARLRYLERFRPVVTELLGAYLHELGAAELRLSAGWRAEREHGLLVELEQARSADRARGHTTRGPHRADWSLRFAHAARREELSRGQEKLCAIACMLAQAELYRADHGEWPIVILDDLPSELDGAHQDQVLRTLGAMPQVFLTSTEIPPTVTRTGTPYRSFHVEQGQVQALL